MEVQTEVSAAPAPVADANNAERKSAENVGINQAVARMLQAEQASAAQEAKADAVPQAEEASTPPPAEESAQATSVEAEATEAQAEPEAEADPVLSHEDTTLDPKIQELVNKRIEKRVAKEVAKRKALETQLNDLKLGLQAQAQQSQQPPPTIVPLPEGAPPLANINDANGLEALKEQALQAKDWAQMQLDEGVGTVQMGGQTYSERELKAIIRNANNTIERDIPKRAQFLAQRHSAQQEAFKEFPFLLDRSSPDYVAAQTAYQSMPWLNNLPNADWIIGVQIEGLKSLNAKKQAAEKKATKPAVTTAPKPPVSQTAVSASGATSRVAAGTRAQQEISAIRASQSRKGGVTANEAIAALTKIEQLKAR